MSGSGQEGWRRCADEGAEADGVVGRCGRGGADRGGRVFGRRIKIPRPASRGVGLEEVGRGCAKIDPHCNRESGFFIVAAEKFFSFRPDWHQDPRAQPVIRHYQTALDSVLQSQPELAPCVKECVHCRIRFLTHPRNACRLNLRCPFGCREHHRRQRARQRSAAYYRTADGWWKKKCFNLQRGGGSSSAVGESPRNGTSDAQDPVANCSCASPPTPPGQETLSQPSPATPGPETLSEPSPATFSPTSALSPPVVVWPGESPSPAGSACHTTAHAVVNSGPAPPSTRPGQETFSHPHPAAKVPPACALSPPAESESCASPAPSPPPPPWPATPPPVESPPWQLPLTGVELDEASVTTSRLLPYVTLVVNLIEGRSFGCQEVAERLRRTMRQHRFAKRRRRDYVLWVLHHHPPWEDSHERNCGTVDAEPAV